MCSSVRPVKLFHYVQNIGQLAAKFQESVQEILQVVVRQVCQTNRLKFLHSLPSSLILLEGLQLKLLYF